MDSSQNQQEQQSLSNSGSQAVLSKPAIMDPLSAMAQSKKPENGSSQNKQGVDSKQNAENMSGQSTSNQTKVDIFQEQQAYTQQYKNFKEQKGLDSGQPKLTTTTAQPSAQNNNNNFFAPTKQVVRGSNMFQKPINPDQKHLDEYGEKLETGFDVKEGSKSVIGRLILTNYKLKFVPNGVKEPTDLINNANSIPYGYIWKVKPVQDLKHFVIELTTKDQRVLRFKFEDSNLWKQATDEIRNNVEVIHSGLFCHRILDAIRIEKRQSLQESNHNDKKEANKIKLTSHDDLKKSVLNDYKRQGVHLYPQRFRKFQSDFQTLQRREIYLPSAVYVTAQMLDDQFYKSAQARRFGRFPTLSYLYPINKAAIWRSAEPVSKIGTIGGERCLDDEDYIKEIAKINPEKQVEKKLYIFSGRVPSDKQYGQEDSKNYPHTNKSSYSLEHYKLTNAFQAIWKLAIENGQTEKSDLNFISKLIKTKWVGQVENILNSAFKAANILTYHNANILIYCPNGSDGSCLLSSLTQIIIDPYYRTFDGFKVLIHKEWVYYKHNFAKKLLLIKDNKNIDPRGLNTGSVSSGNNSGLSNMVNYGQVNVTQLANEVKQDVEPLFVLFLDAVAQLVRQNPISFEFTSSYLAYIGTQLFTGKYFEFVQTLTKRKLTSSMTQNSGSNAATSQPQLQPEELAFQSVFDDARLVKLCENAFRNKIFMQNVSSDSDIQASTSMQKSQQVQSNMDDSYYKLLDYDFKNLNFWTEYFDRYNLNSVQQMKLESEQNERFGRASVLAEVREQNGALIEKIIMNLEKFEQLRSSKSEFVLKQQDLDVYNQLIETLEQITKNNYYRPQNQRLAQRDKCMSMEKGQEKEKTSQTPTTGQETTGDTKPQTSMLESVETQPVVTQQPQNNDQQQN